MSGGQEDNYEQWYEEAIIASNELGYSCMSAADVIRAMGYELKAARQQAPAEHAEPSTPMQPVVIAADGAVRFKENRIVSHLLEQFNQDMNELAMLDFTDEDRMQFAQLIGYSVSGYGNLSYASDESVQKADARALLAKHGETGK